MAGRKENLKALMSNTRTRLIVIFTAVLLVFAVTIGFIKIRNATSTQTLADASLTRSPGNIESIPGGLDPTAQYAKLQEEQNISQAVKASKTGSSAIPTIIRTQALGQGVQTVGPAGGIGFTKLAMDNNGAPLRSLWVQKVKDANCSADSVNAVIKEGAVLSDLKDACTCTQLKMDGFKLDDLKIACTCPELKAAGYSAIQLKSAGYTAPQLAKCQFNLCELQGAGFSPKDLQGLFPAMVKQNPCDIDALKADKADGMTVGEIRAQYGCPDKILQSAGFTDAELGTVPELSNISPLPKPANPEVSSSASQLQAILNRQNQAGDLQRNQQKIGQRTSELVSAATQALGGWKGSQTQTYVGGTPIDTPENSSNKGARSRFDSATSSQSASTQNAKALVKTGDILFAVMDTSVNSDEPGPILATIVSGRFKGAKLIGSFNLPNNATKMSINFNTMSVSGAPRTTSISAYAIDPDTARTALSSQVNQHYLMRYGSLFASAFLEGIGNAFQSANTTITIGGTGAPLSNGNNTVISQGVDRSLLENTVIGLTTVGKSWGQVAKQNFNTPTTVQVFSGTPIVIKKIMKNIILMIQKWGSIPRRWKTMSSMMTRH
jgi:intracellular multiplication protein IcmE